MRSNLILALVLLALMPLVFAQTAEMEKKFSELGYGDLIVEGEGESSCFDVSFVNQELEGFYPILSLKVEFLPEMDGKAEITVKLNEKEVAKLSYKEFTCDGWCWARVNLDKKDLVSENALHICATNGEVINQTVVSKESLIGYYRTPLFLKGDFETKASKTTLYLGEEIEVKMIVHNRGSFPATLDLNFVKPIVEENGKLKNIEVIGDTYYSDIEINAGEIREFTYSIKPKKAIEMSIPPAVMYFTNVFGEKQKVISNAEYLSVKDIDKKLEGKILSEKNVFETGENAKVNVAVTNVSAYSTFNAKLSLVLPNEVFADKTEELVVNIKPKETKLFSFELHSSSDGKYDIGCDLEYTDLELESNECSEMEISFEKKGLNPFALEVIAFVIVGILIALGIWHYVYWPKKEPKLGSEEPVEKKGRFAR